MGDYRVWRSRLTELRQKRLDMTMPDMAKDFSLWLASLEDRQITTLSGLGIKFDYDLTKDVIAKFETKETAIPSNRDRWKFSLSNLLFSDSGSFDSGRGKSMVLIMPILRFYDQTRNKQFLETKAYGLFRFPQIGDPINIKFMSQTA